MGQRFASPSAVIRTSLAAAVVAAFALASTGARADVAAAAEHAKKAQAAYDVQSWTTAIQEYQAAYQSEQKPEYLWGLAQAQRLGGDCTAAIRSFKAFKRADVSATQGTAAEMQITKCEAELEKKEAEAARKGAEPPVVTPAPAPAPAAASPPPVGAPPKDGPPAYKPFYADVLGDTLFVGGVVAAGVGAFFLFTGNSDMKSASAEPTYRDYDTKVNDAQKKQTIGGVVLGVGGGLVALSVVRWLTMDHGGAAPRAERTSLLLGPGSAFLRTTF